MGIGGRGLIALASILLGHWSLFSRGARRVVTMAGKSGRLVGREFQQRVMIVYNSSEQLGG